MVPHAPMGFAIPNTPRLRYFSRRAGSRLREGKKRGIKRIERAVLGVTEG